MEKKFTRHRWTQEQDEYLKANYPNRSMPELTDFLKASEKAIYSRAAYLGIKKSIEYLQSEAACRLRRGDNVGEPFRFKKGHVTWNKGKSFVAGGRSSETRFKKGSSPKNTMPIGSYRLSKDGYLQRKISNDSGNSSKRWRAVHELVWIEANGEIPKGHICIFKPGMKTTDLENITADSVECISRAENMKRNSYHRYGKEIAALVQLRGAINRQINKRRNKDEQPSNT